MKEKIPIDPGRVYWQSSESNGGTEYTRIFGNGRNESIKFLENGECVYRCNVLGIEHILCWDKDGLLKSSIIRSAFSAVYDASGNAYLRIGGCDRFIPLIIDSEQVLTDIEAQRGIFFE